MDNQNTKKVFTEEEKKKAAYALNMCTVSVSQIVDYNDLYILEQEYDAILNNLNLENMPKDEALLKILVELLNTITFFRIQEMKKEQIEKKYQNRMKNAIWSAIPNIGVIVTGGNPIAIGAALATQIGAGYMNYRKEKAQASIEKEDKEIELRIAAIEQFNALRRELFTTAWRMSAEYNFPERYRLTERQIEQYNHILMDCDDYRQYARLEAVKDYFEAYPAFWYNLGHAACSIAQANSNNKTKEQYFMLAKKYFDEYEKLDTFNILRENQTTASWALEYIDLILVENENKNGRLCLTSEEKKKVTGLLDRAVKNAGNRFDILQMCAVSYLRIGDPDTAEKYLKVLVNEDYNRTINGQILSGIYVKNRNYAEYGVLETRVPKQYLYPMPPENSDIKLLREKFDKKQRRLLKEEFKAVLLGTIDKYTEQLNRKVSYFDLNKEYEEQFFGNTDRAKRERRTEARNIFLDAVKSSYYVERLKNLNLPLVYTQLLEDLFEKLFTLEVFKDTDYQKNIVAMVTAAIRQDKDEINAIQNKLYNNSFTEQDYALLQRYDIMRFTKKAFETLFRRACAFVEEMDSTKLMSIEGDLIALCEKIGISDPEIMMEYQKGLKESKDRAEEYFFDISMFGANAIVAKQNTTFLKEMAAFAKRNLNTIRMAEHVRRYYKDDKDDSFSAFFSNVMFEEYPDLEGHSIAVLQNSKDRFDMIFTTEGIVYVEREHVRKKVPYEHINLAKDALDLWGKKYKTNDIDLTNLARFIRVLNGKFIGNSQDRIDYFSRELTPGIANQWFKDRSEAMSENIEKVYALPTTENLEAFHFSMDREYDCEHFLLQFFYDKETGIILGMRILEYESINSAFEKSIKEKGVWVLDN